MSAMNTLTFSTSCQVAPAAVRIRSMSRSVCVVSGPTPPGTSSSPSPEPSVPATKISSSVSAACENCGSRPSPSTMSRSVRAMRHLGIRTNRATRVRRHGVVPMRQSVSVPGWICPDCGRQFGRAGQSHECAPAMTLEEYFSTGPPHERPVFDAVMRHLSSLGPVHVEPVSVGIFLKTPRKLAELRPMQRWVALSFSLRRRASHRTIVRKVMPYNGRFFHVANLTGPSDVDEALCDLLTEAYDEAAERPQTTGGPSTRAASVLGAKRR